MSITLTDNRDLSEKEQVFMAVVDRMTFTSPDHAEQQETVILNGVITRIILVLSDSQNAITAVLTIDDANGIEVFNSGAKDENDTYIMDLDCPVVGEITIGLDPSADPGDVLLADIILYGE